MSKSKNAKRFGTRWGFILASVGSAVGMANVWGFPNKMGQNGGGAFLLIYLLFVVLFGCIALPAEFAVGRWAGTGTLGSYARAWRSRSPKAEKAGGALGWLPLAGSMCIAIGYAVIVSYVLKALVDSVTGTLMTVDTSSWFQAFSTKDFSVVPYHIIVVVGTLLTLLLGANSIEKTNKVMMPLFFIIFLVLAVRVALLPGAAAVENPGYSRTRAVLENNGIPCVPVEIDESGLPIRALEQSGANLCYVTPSHHFPTGVTMPAPRRAQLLAWAAAKPGRFILEDDYDSEFRFATRPLPSLQGMSGANGPVVYLTTFSKSLAPGMRIACMVLPQGLLERYQSDFSMYANTVSRYEQQTLCEFMANGYFARHIARMRLTYKRRMEAFAAALHAGLDPDLTLAGAHSGLHFLLTLPGAGGEQARIHSAEALHRLGRF